MAKPIKEFRAGQCRASIFENQREYIKFKLDSGGP
jgi:hypothetical protein